VARTGQRGFSVYVNRRAFLKSACAGLAGSGVAIGARSTLKTSLNAYSFNKMLNDNIKGRGEGVTLLQVLEFAAKCKFDGFDATAYYFPGYPEVPPDDCITAFKRRAADLGLGISGTGVRNNFTTSDKAVRAEGVAHIKQFTEVAAKLGAPVIRVFADTQMRNQTWQTVSGGASRSEVRDWIATALRECADHASKFRVKIGVQNHGDFLKTGKDLLELVQAVGSEWCGPIVDTGYFRTSDPYAEIGLVAPQAVNWQIKQSPAGEDSEVPTDMIKLMRIIRKSGYQGYLPIETLSPRGKPYDPYTVVPQFLKQLRDVIAQTA
jgi:sugar phosphate isomerase/epimerase